MLTRCWEVLLICAIVVTDGGYGASVDTKVDTTYNTIVVGLGSAGATAATTLARSGRRVLAVEAQDRIGGRVRTIDLVDGVVELGAEWIHGTRINWVYDAAVSAHVPIQAQNITLKVYRSDGSPVDQELIDEINNYAFKELRDTRPEEPQPLGKYVRGKLVEYLKEHRPDCAKDETFVKNILHLIDVQINALAATSDPDELHTADHYHGLRGSWRSWHRYGYKTYFEIMLNKYNNSTGLPNLEIKLNTEVTKIKCPQDPKENVEVTTKDGSVYHGKHVRHRNHVNWCAKRKDISERVDQGGLDQLFIFTRHTTLFSPPLPKAKVEAIEKISIGLLGKIILYFDEPWWPSDKNVWHALLWKEEDKQKLAEKDRWILKVTGPSSSMGNDHTLTLWSSGETMKLIETLPEEDVLNNCINYLKKFMDNVRRPTSIIRSQWFHNPFTRGAYTHNNVYTLQHPNIRSDLAGPLTDSAGNHRVLFAGEATSDTRFGTVHGASETGYREATRVLSLGFKHG